LIVGSKVARKRHPRFIPIAALFEGEPIQD
jgi:hypothetical protein